MKPRAHVPSVWQCLLLITTLMPGHGIAQAQPSPLQSTLEAVAQTVEQGGLSSLDPTLITSLGRSVANTSNDSLATAVEKGELQT